MSNSVRLLLDQFDALPDLDKQTAAAAILRRTPADDLPFAALDELADELFSALDAEEDRAAGP
jgi:hypothetical protein